MTTKERLTVSAAPIASKFANQQRGAERAQETVTTPLRQRLAEEQAAIALYFPRYLRHVKIRDAKRGIIPLERWPHLIEAAEHMQSNESLLVGKSRQLGWSWLLAIYDSWLLLTQQDTRILSISAGQLESMELLAKVKTVLDNLPPWLRMERYYDSETKLSIKATGGQMLALPSTPKAGRGFDARLVQLDEAAFHPYAGENYAAFHSAVADGNGQEIFVTTGNGPTGLFHEMWMDPDNSYTKLFYPWSARPDRDEEWYRKEYADFISAGTRHPSLFRRENPSSVEEMFTAFFGRVYEMFSSERHVKEAPVAWEKCKWRVAGVDPGQGDNAAIVIIGEDDRGRAHQYAEYVFPGVVTEQNIRDAIRPWQARGQLAAVPVDYHEGTLIATLRANGIPAVPSNSERGMGIGHVASRLEAGNFTVGRDCQQTISEFGSYRWRERRAAGEADPYMTSTPADNHADCMDAIRYALVYMSQFLANKREVQVLSPQYAGPISIPGRFPTSDMDGNFTDPVSKAYADRGKIPTVPGRAGPNYRARKVRTGRR